jgi:hypothetical protein
MDDRAEGIERRFEIPILVAALLVIPVIAIDSLRSTSRGRSSLR